MVFLSLSRFCLFVGLSHISWAEIGYPWKTAAMCSSAVHIFSFEAQAFWSAECLAPRNRQWTQHPKWFHRSWDLIWYDMTCYDMFWCVIAWHDRISLYQMISSPTSNRVKLLPLYQLSCKPPSYLGWGIVPYIQVIPSRDTHPEFSGWCWFGGIGGITKCRPEKKLSPFMFMLCL